jgi:adenylate cyclase
MASLAAALVEQPRVEAGGFDSRIAQAYNFIQTRDPPHGTDEVSDVTTRPTTGEQLLRLSRLAEDLRGRLESLAPQLSRSKLSLPSGTLEGLRYLGGNLLAIRATVEGYERELGQLRALAEIGRVVNSSLDLGIVLNEVIDTIIRLTGAERAFLMMRNESGAMDTVVARNWERESLGAGEIEISRKLVERVLVHGDPIVTTNAQSDPRFTAFDSVVAYNLRSILCVPLKLKGSLTGVIYADNRMREGIFGERERELLLAFADQAATALENARLFDSVSRTLGEVTELKDLMEDVFASIVSGVITADADGVINLTNQPVEVILARSKDKLLGQALKQLLEEISPGLVERVDSVVESDQRIVAVESHPMIVGRGPVSLSLTLSPLKRSSEERRGVAMVIADHTETRRLEARQRLFARMVSPAVIDQLDPDSLQLGGQLLTITTLFADIRGFTSFSEITDPATLVDVLNRYLAAATRPILEEGGTIDKFVGDAIMAWFNAPLPQTDHVLRAAKAALGLRQAAEEVSRELDPAMRLDFGIGLHCGEALLGLIGSQERLDYTALGDSVNTAKRLQEHAAPGQILISQEAACQGGELLLTRPAPAVRAAGKERPIEVLELLGLRA